MSCWANCSGPPPRACCPAVAILLVVWVLGLYASFGMTLALLPVALLTGFCFAGLGLAINAVSPNYDFFLYYFTLAITPMILLGGVFYPPTALPAWLADIAAWLPLTHAIELARPLVLGKWPKACCCMRWRCWPMGRRDLPPP
jgi:lipooligosaccharide transport system permease protein